MSDNLPKSSRLDSLSRRATPGSKPGLKFKPKVVARRSKEERDADAPVTAPDSDKPARGAANRGRGASRGGRGGGRGGRAIAGTHVVQEGPLASGIVSSSEISRQPARNFARSTTASPTPEYLSNLIKKEGATRASSISLDSDDEEAQDLTKINMNEKYKFSAEETELFPVRAPRLTSEDNNKVVNVPSRSVSPDTDDVSVTDAEPTKVKDEPLEKDLSSILKSKESELQRNLKIIQSQREPLPVDATEAEEAASMIHDDHISILKTLTSIDNKKDQFMLFQLPKILPEFENLSLNDIKKPEVPGVKVKNETNDVKLTGEVQNQLEGNIAKLRVHKSGKMTIKIGEVVMDVGKGSKTKFLQEVVVSDKQSSEDQEQDVNKIHGQSYLIGHVEDKVVITPKFA